MNADKMKGIAQKIGGRIEESAGALVGSESLKDAGKEDQLKGAAREAWGNVKDAGNNLIDQARAAKSDAETKTAESQRFEDDHRVLVEKAPEPAEPAKS